jgi:hypothetical protein
MYLARLSGCAEWKLVLRQHGVPHLLKKTFRDGNCRLPFFIMFSAFFRKIVPQVGQELSYQTIFRKKTG